MRIDVLILVLLTISCLALPVIAGLTVFHDGLHFRHDTVPGQSSMRTVMVHTDDPGSGGGSAGVIK
jgi:hypothetical protein